MENNAKIEANKEVREDEAERTEHPIFVEEFEIEEMSVDGICGVY